MKSTAWAEDAAFAWLSINRDRGEIERRTHRQAVLVASEQSPMACSSLPRHHGYAPMVEPIGEAVFVTGGHAQAADPSDAPAFSG